MSSRGLWLRWSLRDLRRRWAAVVAIALVIGIGIGVYSGFGSTSAWRRLSNDASFAALRMHDLRVELSPGTFIEEGTLAAAAGRIRDAESIAVARERVVVDSQIDASVEGRPVLTAARLVGMDVVGPPVVDGLWIEDGALPAAGRQAQAVLERSYADHWGLPPSGRLLVSGGERIDYVGVGAIPEDFFYEGPEGSVLSQGELAPVYLPLAEAQRIIGRPGEVNDLVLRLGEGADREAVRAQLADAVAGLGVGATVSTRDDADAVRVLYDDIDNDQRFWNALAGLVLGAAALAAFNLISRIVESQRREIGIGMALGVPRRMLALRPMLIGVQIALVGTLAGVAVGILVGRAMQGLLESVLPLPEYRTPFQLGVYARGALLGLAIPLVASVIPVWRAVRVEPVAAIRTGHLAARAGRLSDWTGRIRLPGSSLTLMPVRNVLRAPRRTILTAVSVGAAITALVGVLGLLDSFQRTIDVASTELTKGDPGRVVVQLDTFHPADSEVVAAIRGLPSVGAVDPGLRLPATIPASVGDEELDLLVGLVDIDGAGWTPTLAESAPDPAAGIILARKAARDAGVGVGDTVALRHPVREQGGAFALAESTATVTGIHVNPLRSFAYMDIAQAQRFGLAGAVNVLDVHPAPGATRFDVQKDVFALPGVAVSQSVGRLGESFEEVLDQFVGFLAIAAAAVLALALLIAFNASRISVEERRREHATMRAFGLPVRSVVGVVVAEGVIVGVVATAIGIGAGMVFIDWMLRSLAATTLPDLGIARHLSSTTLWVAAAVGIAAVAVAPLLLIGRIRRMDIPDTLRVME